LLLRAQRKRSRAGFGEVMAAFCGHVLRVVTR
jgi:hypothetical protein